MVKISTYYGFRSCISKARIAAATTSLIIIFSILNPALALILDGEEVDPLDDGGDVQPQDTIGWNTLGRTEEAVVVPGDQVSDLFGTSVNNTDVFSQDNDILVYAWNGSTETWKQIPFQVDERNPDNGSWTVNNTNGVMDGYDEIVFMSGDASDRASENEWVVGCDAPRYEVEIIDLDTGNSAWAYIYKSSRIEADFTEDYVRFDTDANDVFTDSYTMGFRDGVGMIMDYFNVTEAKGGDGEDLVDTLEIEAIATLGIFKLIYDENDLGSDFTLKKDGYVRALGVVSWHIYQDIFGIIVDAYFNFTWKFYPEHVNATGYMDIYIDGPVTVDIWLALDHISTSIPMDYRDLSGNTAVINGIDDDNIIVPDVQGWWEVSSPHGGYVCIWDIGLQSESSMLKFDDNSSAEDHNNTEPGLYGRTGGIFLNITHNQLSFGNISYFPIASDVSGVAEAISYNVTHPLLITTTAQHSPTIWVEKSVDKATASPGEILQYTIYFNNTSLVAAETVWINDTLPAEVTYLNDSSATELGVKTADYNWTFTNVAPGNHSFVINVSLGNATVGTSIDNIVFLSYTTAGGIEMPSSQAWANMTVVNHIILKQGWNLISIPLIQEGQNLTRSLGSIDGWYDSVWLYNVTDANDPWKHYHVSKPSYMNDLDEINHKIGFWIHITNPGGTILRVNGTQPIENQSITLHPGWNLVGYSSLSNKSRDAALNNIIFDTDVDSICTYNTTTQKMERIGKLDNFEVGRGYWIHCISPMEIIWEVPL